MAVRFAAVCFLLLATTSLCAIAKTKRPKKGPPKRPPPPPPPPPPGPGEDTPDWPPGPGGDTDWPPGPGGDTPDWPPGPSGYTPDWPPGPSGYTPGWPPGPSGYKPPGQGGDGGSGCGCSCNSNGPPPRPSKVFNVGGPDKQWSYGTNYTDWVQKTAPFYVGDSLEFKYPPPVWGRPYNHSVYLLRDRESYQTCNLSGSLRIGGVYAGGGSDGFRLKLQKKIYRAWVSDPYMYIACGEKNGLHCGLGTMKFAIMPIFTDFL